MSQTPTKAKRPQCEPRHDQGRDTRQAIVEDADNSGGKGRDLVHGDGGTIGLGEGQDLNHDD